MYILSRSYTKLGILTRSWMNSNRVFWMKDGEDLFERNDGEDLVESEEREDRRVRGFEQSDPLYHFSFLIMFVFTIVDFQTNIYFL